MANQIWFTAITKYTISEIGKTIVCTSMSSIRDNGMGFGKRNNMSFGNNNAMGSAKKVGISSISVNFGGNNGISSDIEVGKSSN